MNPLIIQDQFFTVQNLQRSPTLQTSNWSGTFFCCFLQQTGSKKWCRYVETARKNCAAKKNHNLPCNCSLFAHNHRSQLAMITYDYQLLCSHYNGYLKKNLNHLKNPYIYVLKKVLNFSFNHLSLCTWPSLRFYKKSRLWRKQKNLVKLPYSAQNPLLRASSLILFFVLIFNPV